MSLYKSIVEDVAIEWFGDLGRRKVKSEIGGADFYCTLCFTVPHLAPGELAAEREVFSIAI